MLKLEEIHQYDTAVPMVSDLEMRTSFDAAVETVLDSLRPLGAEYSEALGMGLRSYRWCDRYESKGKRSGAFSSSSYGNPPFILMNYKEDVFSDIYTLAHEAGHSMHTWYSQTHQLSRTTITRFSSRRSPRPSTRSSSPIICSRRPATPRCAPI